MYFLKLFKNAETFITQSTLYIKPVAYMDWMSYSYEKLSFYLSESPFSSIYLEKMLFITWILFKSIRVAIFFSIYDLFHTRKNVICTSFLCKEI